MAHLDKNEKGGEVLELEAAMKPIEESVISPEEDLEAKKLERRLKWKLDLFILPMVSMVYFFASLVSQCCTELAAHCEYLPGTIRPVKHQDLRP